MRERRFIGSFHLSGSELEIRDADVIHQIKNVLRLKTGDEIVLCDGKGTEADARIQDVEKGSVRVSLANKRVNDREPIASATLYIAVLKRENFEWVVQKATELGVREIVPVLSKRTVKLGLKMERLHIVAREAAEQSGRGTVPILHEPLSFRDALADAKRQEMNIFFDTDDSSSVLSYKKAKTISLWIGPEGGWDEEESALAKKVGFQIGNLGNLILRAETAAIASLSVVLLG